MAPQQTTMEVYHLENDFLKMEVLNYGAIIKRLRLKINHGADQDLVVGLKSPEDYLNDAWFLGACLGPFAGRIQEDKILETSQATKASHDKAPHILLHGGDQSYAKQFWTMENIQSGPAASICLSHTQIVETKHEALENKKTPLNAKSETDVYLKSHESTTIKTFVTYSLVNSELRITYHSTSSIPKVFNLSNHSYFTLDNATDISEYELCIKAHFYLETNTSLLPTGKLIPTPESTYDFRKPTQIGHTTLDTPFVLEKKYHGKEKGASVDSQKNESAEKAASIDSQKSESVEKVASVYSQKSTIFLEVFTDQEVIVCFTPKEFPGICFETQGFPDAPNHPNFKTIRIDKNNPYTQETHYKFSLKTNPFNA
ncbi:MAG: hypothetical protein P8N20_09060 [Flavobacteriaceae bacterium]|nr:hypothetical protein [Flavobacteriaceae bacterium]